MVRIAVVVVLALLIGSGCSLKFIPRIAQENSSQLESSSPLSESAEGFNMDPSTGETLDGETVIQTPGPLTRMQLSQALLRLDDVPAGWEEYAQDNNETDEEELYRFLCRTLTREDVEEVVTEYRGSQLGPILVHTIQMYPPGIVEEQFQVREDAIMECAQFETAGEVDLKWTVTPINFPVFGERSTAMRATAEFGASKLEIESLYFVVGDTLTNIQHIQLGDVSPNRQFTLEMAKTASGRVMELMAFK